MNIQPVLVVDDDNALRETLSEAMVSLPVEVTTAATGAAALELLATRKFAVVVTDLKMRDVDGFAVLERAEGALPVLPCCDADRSWQP